MQVSNNLFNEALETLDCLFSWYNHQNDESKLSLEERASTTQANLVIDGKIERVMVSLLERFLEPLLQLQSTTNSNDFAIDDESFKRQAKEESAIMQFIQTSLLLIQERLGGECEVQFMLGLAY